MIQNCAFVGCIKKNPNLVKIWQKYSALYVEKTEYHREGDAVSIIQEAGETHGRLKRVPKMSPPLDSIAGPSSP